VADDGAGDQRAGGHALLESAPDLSLLLLRTMAQRLRGADAALADEH